MGLGAVTRRAGLAVAVCSVAIASALAFWSHYHVEGIDDAWITYRYARNLAEDHGYVYNLGQHVQGTSTPLYTFWLALWGKLGASIPIASTYTALVAAEVTALLLFVWLRRRTNTMGGMVGAFFLVLSPDYSYVMPTGMETAVYCAFIVGAFFAFDVRRYRLAFLLAGLDWFLRLDGIAVLLVLSACFYLRERRMPWRACLTVCSGMSLWYVWSWWYFGSPLPNSMRAKQIHTGHAHLSLWMLDQLWQMPHGLLALSMLGCALCMWRRDAWPLLVLPLWAAVYITLYTVAQISYYQWYTAPVDPVVALLAAYVIGRGGQLFVSHRRGAGLVALLGALLATGSIAEAEWPNFRFGMAPCSPEHARYVGAQYAARHMRPHALLVAGGIGMIGWFSNAPVVDYAGLVSPQTLKARPQPYFYYAAADTVARYQPEYVFDLLGDWPPVVRRNYYAVAQFKPACGGTTPFVLWQKRKNTRAASSGRRRPHARGGDPGKMTSLHALA